MCYTIQVAVAHHSEKRTLQEEGIFMGQKTLRAFFLCALVAASAAGASAQSSAAPQNTNPAATPAASAQNDGASASTSGGLFGFEEMRRQLREQREQID